MKKGGVIRRRNAGAFWTQETSPTSRDLRGLTSTPSGDLYAVGDSATVVRYSGGTWTTTPAPAPAKDDKTPPPKTDDKKTDAPPAKTEDAKGGAPAGGGKH